MIMAFNLEYPIHIEAINLLNKRLEDIYGTHDVVIDISTSRPAEWDSNYRYYTIQCNYLPQLINIGRDLERIMIHIQKTKIRKQCNM